MFLIRQQRHLMWHRNTLLRLDDFLGIFSLWVKCLFNILVDSRLMWWTSYERVNYHRFWMSTQERGRGGMMEHHCALDDFDEKDAQTKQSGVSGAADWMRLFVCADSSTKYDFLPPELKMQIAALSCLYADGWNVLFAGASEDKSG